VSDGNVAVVPSLDNGKSRSALVCPASSRSAIVSGESGSRWRAKTSSRVAAEPSWKDGASWPMPKSDGTL